MCTKKEISPWLSHAYLDTKSSDNKIFKRDQRIREVIAFYPFKHGELCIALQSLEKVAILSGIILKSTNCVSTLYFTGK